MRNNKNEERPLAYPRPTKTDQQLNQQNEFIDEKPNQFPKPVADAPSKADDGRQENLEGEKTDE